MENSQYQYVKLCITMAHARFARIIKTENDIKVVRATAKAIYAAYDALEEGRYEEVKAMLDLVSWQSEQTSLHVEQRFNYFLKRFERVAEEKLRATDYSGHMEERIYAIKETLQVLTKDEVAPEILIELGYEQLAAL